MKQQIQILPSVRGYPPIVIDMPTLEAAKQFMGGFIRQLKIGPEEEKYPSEFSQRGFNFAWHVKMFCHRWGIDDALLFQAYIIKQ